jgi:hypothetical protein
MRLVCSLERVLIAKIVRTISLRSPKFKRRNKVRRAQLKPSSFGCTVSSVRKHKAISDTNYDCVASSGELEDSDRAETTAANQL